MACTTSFPQTPSHSHLPQNLPNPHRALCIVERGQHHAALGEGGHLVHHAVPHARVYSCGSCCGPLGHLGGRVGVIKAARSIDQHNSPATLEDQVRHISYSSWPRYASQPFQPGRPQAARAGFKARKPTHASKKLQHQPNGVKSRATVPSGCHASHTGQAVSTNNTEPRMIPSPYKLRVVGSNSSGVVAPQAVAHHNGFVATHHLTDEVCRAGHIAGRLSGGPCGLTNCWVGPLCKIKSREATVKQATHCQAPRGFEQLPGYNNDHRIAGRPAPTMTEKAQHVPALPRNSSHRASD